MRDEAATGEDDGAAAIGQRATKGVFGCGAAGVECRGDTSREGGPGLHARRVEFAAYPQPKGAVELLEELAHFRLPFAIADFARMEGVEVRLAAAQVTIEHADSVVFVEGLHQFCFR